MMVEQSQRQIELLYIEDNPADIRLIKEALKGSRLPFHVEAAPDGVEALLRVNQLGRFSEVEKPDLILLDLGLPKLSGLTVLNEIRRNPFLKGIPVIVFTGSREGSDVDEAQRLEADLYITKPHVVEGYGVIAKEIEDFWLMSRQGLS